jgi:hypothetical protein
MTYKKKFKLKGNYKLQWTKMGAITIQRIKKGDGPQGKTIKIRYIFMFFHLKPWQVIILSLICMSTNSNQKSICWNFKFKF